MNKLTVNKKLLKLLAVGTVIAILIGFVTNSTIVAVLVAGLIWALHAFFTIVEVIAGPDFPFQVSKQLISTPCVYVKNKFKLPCVESFNQLNKYSLPFEGEWLVFNGGTCKKTSHSWGILPQRYAYDFVITDADGFSYEGSGGNNDNYYCYGKNILAPSDGVVVKVCDMYPDNEIVRPGKVKAAVDDIRGNFVIIKHSAAEYSTLAHLQKGSISVKNGQMVKQGDVVARCGNSGYSTEPHLHFQVQNSKSFFFSAGLPIKFNDFYMRIHENTDSKPPCSFEGLNSNFISKGFLVKPKGVLKSNS